MFKPQLPLCSYPARVVCIDDDQAWLQGVEREIADFFPCSLYDSPRVALEELSKLAKQPRALSLACDELLAQEVGLECLATHAKRFDDIAVLVVDYQMPEMNGLSFCEALKSFPCKKILLTAEADEALAVEAFNSGLIDAYIKKSDEQLIDKLLLNLHELTELFFKEMTSEYMAVLRNNELGLSPIFFDQECLEKFYQLLNELNATEFYFASRPGNFFLMNESGGNCWLCIRSLQELDDDLNWFEDRYDDLENKTERVEAWFNDFKRHRLLSFFYPSARSSLPLDDWGPFIHQCKPLASTKLATYFYSVVSSDEYIKGGRLQSFY